jgi:hypothetical protein
MGRFMVQLFGAKREPWVEAPAHEKTEINDGAAATDTDNEKTTVLGEQHPPELQRMATAPLHVGAQRVDAAGWQQADARASRASPMPGRERTPPPQLDGGAPARPTPQPRATPPSPLQAQPLLDSDDLISDVGARPLIDDKLAWQPAPGHRNLAPQGGATRLPSEAADYRLRASNGWLIFAVVLVILSAAAVAAIGLEWIEL